MRVGSSPFRRTTSEQASYRLLRLIFISQNALILLLLLSKPDPLRWAPKFEGPRSPARKLPGRLRPGRSHLGAHLFLRLRALEVYCAFLAGRRFCYF